MVGEAGRPIPSECMPFANVVLNGAAMVAVWVTPSGFGAKL
jgi:hypothetical protein